MKAVCWGLCLWGLLLPLQAGAQEVEPVFVPTQAVKTAKPLLPLTAWTCSASLLVPGAGQALMQDYPRAAGFGGATALMFGLGWLTASLINGLPAADAQEQFEHAATAGAVQLSFWLVAGGIWATSAADAAWINYQLLNPSMALLPGRISLKF